MVAVLGWEFFGVARGCLSAVFLYESLGLFVEAVQEEDAGCEQAEHQSYPYANWPHVEDMAQEVTGWQTYHVV